MNTLFTQNELAFLVPKSLEEVFLSIAKRKLLRFQETIIKESINEICKNDSFREQYIDFTLNCITFKLYRNNSEKEEKKTYTFLMPPDLPEARHFYRTNPEFKIYVDENIKPFLNMDKTKFIDIIFEEFPEITKEFSKIGCENYIYLTKTSLFEKDSQIDQYLFENSYHYSWCKFFFNFSTIENLLKYKDVVPFLVNEI